MAQNGAARSRLATRESFFGGPLSTRELCKAPNWQDLVKKEAETRTAPPPAGKRDAGSKAAPRPAQRPREPSPDPELLRRQKLKQRRDFSGLNDDGEGPGAASGSEARAGPSGRSSLPQSAAAAARGPAGGKAGGGAGAAVSGRQQSAGARPGDMGASSRGVRPGALHANGGKGSSAQPGQAAGGAAAFPGKSGQLGASQKGSAGMKGGGSGGQQRPSTHVVVVKGGSVKGAKGSGSRKLAMEPTAVGKSRKQVATEALQARCDAIREEAGRLALTAMPAPPTRPASSAGPSASPAVAAAAAAAARIAREAAAAKGTMQRHVQKTGLGMQTQLLVKRPPGQQPPQAPARAGPAQSPVSSTAMLKWQQLSPQQQRWVLRQRQQAAAARGAGEALATGSKLQNRSAFYGGQQPQSVLQAKRRLSIESEGSLDGFIVDDDELEYYEGGEEEDIGDAEGGEDWRAALREALGGYDPSKFADIDAMPDRGMEVGYNDIVREEMRSKRIAREEDAREEELERLREANKREKKRRKKGAAAFFDDD